MKKSILDLVLSIARRNTRHPEKDHFLHYSFVIQDNKVIEWGMNNPGVPAIHHGYHNRIKDERYAPKTHSELDAWKKARGIMNKRKGFEIVNIRLNKSGDLRISKPCPCCYEIMKNLGCTKFYYSWDMGFLTCG